MKTKTATKTLCLLITLCLLLSSASAASFVNETVQPRYSSVVQFMADMEMSSSGRADCYASVTVSGSDTVVLIMSLKRSEDGITWSNAKTWSTSGSGTVALEESCYVSSGYYYKVNATATVYTASGHYIETADTASVTINYGVR